MMLCMFVAWVLGVSVEVFIHISVLRLMLLVSMVIFSSTFLTNYFMVFVKRFPITSGEDVVVLLMVWVL